MEGIKNKTDYRLACTFIQISARHGASRARNWNYLSCIIAPGNQGDLFDQLVHVARVR